MPQIELIDNRGLKDFWRNATEWGFTTIMWALWLYLFLPLLNVILWAFGVRIFYIELVQKKGYLELLRLLENLGWIVLVIVSVLSAWGYYNYKRFGKKERRKHSRSSSTEALSAVFGIPSDKIVELQESEEVFWPPGGDPERCNSGPENAPRAMWSPPETEIPLK